MRASWIALGVAVGLAVLSVEAAAQQAAGVPRASALPNAPTGLQGVQNAIQGVLPGTVVNSPVQAQPYPYPTAPVVGSAPIIGGDPSVQRHPYSYYTAFPAPARTYVEYGAMDQFPFQGQMYGNPGDRWSWSGMTSNRAAGLDRYYYPLLP